MHVSPPFDGARSVENDKAGFIPPKQLVETESLPNHVSFLPSPWRDDCKQARNRTPLNEGTEAP
jgi:hypothetical protein